MLAVAIEIARVGRWPNESGVVIEITPQILKETASSYDPSRYRAPFIVTHDEYNQPSWSSKNKEEPWKAGALVKRLYYKSGRLYAEPEKVDPEYRKLFTSGRIPALSTKFYRPEDPGNPTPGRWNLRHVAGVLIPGIKGMAVPQFADSDQGVSIVFKGDGMADLKLLFEGLRRYLVDVVGEEEAESYLPLSAIAAMTANGAKVEKKPEIAMGGYKLMGDSGDEEDPEFAEDLRTLRRLAYRANIPGYAQMTREQLESLLLKSPHYGDVGNDKSATQEEDISILKAENERLKAALEKASADSLHSSAVAFAESLDLMPDQRDLVIAGYIAAAKSGEISFSEGGKSKTIDPLEGFKLAWKNQRRARPPQGSLNMGEDPTFAEGSIPPAPEGVNAERYRLQQRAHAYARQHGVSLDTAYKVLGVA